MITIISMLIKFNRLQAGQPRKWSSVSIASRSVLALNKPLTQFGTRGSFPRDKAAAT
jgi:hypothetical protein